MRTIQSIALLMCIISFYCIPALYAQDTKEIIEKSIELTRVDAMEMISTLTIIDAKGRPAREGKVPVPAGRYVLHHHGSFQ